MLGEYETRKGIIKSRLEDFSNVKGDDVFYELCFCLLTPQSSARNCDLAIKKLKEMDFKNNSFNPVKVIEGKARFHFNKAKYVMEMKEKYNEIKNKIDNEKNNYELRGYLVENVKGLGYKEAGHFLRNIGRRGLAILDRHILNNLFKYKVIDEIPKSLSKKKYLEIEKKFKDFSREVGIDMDEIDLLFWSMQTGEVFK